MSDIDSNALPRKNDSGVLARRQPPNAVARKQAADGVARKQARSAATPAALLEAAQPPITPLKEMEGDPNFMTSLARGLAVIQAFSQARRELTISQISSQTGFSRAAVRRCLYTLVKLSFAGTDDNRHYYLRPRVLTLGHSYISSIPLAAAAQPILDHVSHVLRESCSIATLDGTEIVYIARANVTRIMSIDLGVGSRLPAYCTTMGRILLAHLPVQEAEEILSRIEFRRFTERTVVGVEKLRQILRVVQRNGYSIVDQELEHGLRAVAVPIRNPAGQVVAALNVGVHAQRVSIQELQTRFLHHLRSAAVELCMFLR
jgi:IclR family pca regulon transcriptional regulator